jgi:predicted DNA-binding transcriptional regulator AlpA
VVKKTPEESVGFAETAKDSQGDKQMGYAVAGKRLIGVKELSTYIGLKPQTIYNMVCTGRFPIRHKRLGRLLKWDVRDVDSYVDSLAANN